METKSFISLLAVFFFSGLAEIYLVFRMKSNFLTGFLLLVVLGLLGLILLTAVYKRFKWSYYYGLVYFMLLMLNFAYLYIYTRRFLPFSFAVLVSLIGYITCETGFMGAIKRKTSRNDINNIEDRKYREAEKIVPNIEVYADVEPGYEKEFEKRFVPEKFISVYTDEEVSSDFTPGNFVSSKKGSIYHLPKCDAVKNILEENKVWFNSEQEARRSGYKKHICFK